MKTFKEFRRELEEHPSIGKRIMKAINPVEKIRDKMADIKKKLIKFKNYICQAKKMKQNHYFLLIY